MPELTEQSNVDQLADPTFTREMQERVCRFMDQASSVPYTVPWNYKQPEVDAVDL